MVPANRGRGIAAATVLAALLAWSRTAHADPSIVVSPTTFDFGTVEPGSSAGALIMVRNVGSSAALDLTGATISPAGSYFSFLSVPGSPSCAGGTSCTFNPPLGIGPGAVGAFSVQCAPPVGAAGSRAAVLTVASNSTTAGGNTVNLTCSAPGSPTTVPSGNWCSLALISAGLAGAGLVLSNRRRGVQTR
jgi:hypothetical protein